MITQPRRFGRVLHDTRPILDWPRVDRSAECLDYMPRELSDNRERYIEQSRNTKNGVVAPLPPSRPAGT